MRIQKLVKVWPKNGVYDVTRSGWFNSRIFEIWFFKLFVPAVCGRGKVALIGDNLGSHFSRTVNNKCSEENISFICLPPNATHLCPPLDVSLFRPAKSEWHNILDMWHKESRLKENLHKIILARFSKKQ